MVTHTRIHTIFRTGKLKFDIYFHYASNISNSKFCGVELLFQAVRWITESYFPVYMLFRKYIIFITESLFNVIFIKKLENTYAT